MTWSVSEFILLFCSGQVGSAGIKKMAATLNSVLFPLILYLAVNWVTHSFCQSHQLHGLDREEHRYDDCLIYIRPIY